MDLSPYAEAKADRLTADDLIGGPRTVRISAVSGSIEDGKKQAIINFEGDEGKPFKPCKTMVRVMMAIWGKYASEYVGRNLTLYRNPDVTFGALATGGVRISHMSHMDEEAVVIVASKKGKKAPIKILPLVAEVKQMPDPAQKWADAFLAKVAASNSVADLSNFVASKNEKLTELAEKKPDLHATCVSAAVKRETQLADAAATEQPADDDAALFGETEAE